jgi:hypothetical protein
MWVSESQDTGGFAEVEIDLSAEFEPSGVL